MNTNSISHQNRIGLPWIYVRPRCGHFGSDIGNIPHVEFDQFSNPTKDNTGHWVFSLKLKGEDVCMVRCWGKRAKEEALAAVNAALDVVAA